ncbi:MAG: ParB N-terminal domain-containing protein [Alphaproteobacteria bacterium]|nr:ParB N-terminal domain-containing protein [Alphaproteobacteria bacterium]
MKIQDIEPSELKLDRQNPRFGLSEASSEKEALRILLETADLKELWNSIAERGFEKFEPLVVTNEGGELVVLEGNRRLAAVKLLLDPSLLEKDAPRRRVPSIAPEKLDTCRQLPVVIVKNREAAAGYIGFKHVNGPARWSSLAKARFGVRFYQEMDGRLTPQQRMQSLTNQLGDSRGVILRLLVAYKIVQQSIDLGHFDQLNLAENSIEFSHLYTLINNPDSREFIGLPRAPLNEGLVRANPIPVSHHPQLLEVMGWLYGDKSVIRSQGTDRPRLQRVLASSEGIRELRMTGNLADAETVAGLKSEDWLVSLAKAHQIMQKIASDATIVVGDLKEDELANSHSLLSRLERSFTQVKAIIPNIKGG